LYLPPGGKLNYIVLNSDNKINPDQGLTL
jgi:hypothetical protein